MAATTARCCLFALVLAGAAGAATQTSSPPAEVAFERILWMHRGPARTPELYRAIAASGFTAVSVSADEDPAEPGRHGLRFYRDQVAGKGILELRAPDFERVRAAYERSRDPRELVRPACLARPQTMERLRQVLDHRLRRALPHRPIAVSLGDEISITRHANPLDFCFSAESLAAFRAFLRRRYATIEALDRTWETDFDDFAQVLPFSADRIRAREFARAGGGPPRNLRPWAEHREFMDAELARVLAELAARVARLASPRLPCGLTGMQPPSAYGGHDYRRLMPWVTFYEVYDTGGARDLAMSLARPDALQMATLFPLRDSESEAMVTARVADLLAHGMAGVIVWSAQDVFGEDLALTRFGAAVSKALAALRGAFELGGARLRRDPVWIVDSQASVRVHWMLDSMADGATWIRRRSSYEARHSTSLASRHAWVRLFEDLGLQARLVPEEELAQRLPRTRPRMLVLAATVALSDEAVAAIESYAREGGFVVADFAPAFYDERGTLRRRPALDHVFGVRRRGVRLPLVREGRTPAVAELPTGASAAEAAVGGDLVDPQGEYAVQIEHVFGEGKAVYLNLAVCEYGAARLEPRQVRRAFDLRRRVARLLDEAGVFPPVLVSAPGLPTCLERMVLRTRHGAEVLAVRLNALENPPLFEQIAARGPVTARLRFPQAVALRDLLDGGRRAAARTHEVRLDPVRGLFLEVLRGR